MSDRVLVRYGVMGEVARVPAADVACDVGASVVLRSPRGEEIGRVIGRDTSADSDAEQVSAVLRLANDEDQHRFDARRAECNAEFTKWQDRIRDWQVEVELIDLEKTLDGEKLVLYVLNGRGPETTKLALRAAAAGFGVIEVQPVGPEGLIQAESGGGCGSCGQKK